MHTFAYLLHHDIFHCLDKGRSPQDLFTYKPQGISILHNVRAQGKDIRDEFSYD